LACSKEVFWATAAPAGGPGTPAEAPKGTAGGATAPAGGPRGTAPDAPLKTGGPL